MKTKELAIRTLEELPEDATWEDVQERINFLSASARDSKSWMKAGVFLMIASKRSSPNGLPVDLVSLCPV